MGFDEHGSCRMVCIGTGPGPKNVLVEFEDGFRTVVPYAIYKHQLKARAASSGERREDNISSTDFMSVVGVIDFDPEQKDINGKATIQFPLMGPGQTRIRVTVWPELKLPQGLLKKGLAIGVRGKYAQGSGQDGAVYHNLTAHTISVGSEVYMKDAAPVVRKDTESEPAF